MLQYDPSQRIQMKDIYDHPALSRKPTLETRFISITQLKPVVDIRLNIDFYWNLDMDITENEYHFVDKKEYIDEFDIIEEEEIKQDFQIIINDNIGFIGNPNGNPKTALSGQSLGVKEPTLAISRFLNKRN